MKLSINITTIILVSLLFASLLFNYFLWRRFDLTPTNNTCQSCPNTIPYQRINNQYLKKLLTNYKKNHWNTINNNLPHMRNKFDSRSVWFDLNTLKNFIADIESKASLSCGDHCKQGLGIRIYFGEYDTLNPNLNPNPMSEMQSAISSGYGGLHTLVMIPTKKDYTKINTDNENVDFDASFMTRMNGCDPKDYNDSMITIMALTAQMDMMNHGTLIPPPNNICTGASFMHFVDVLTCP